MGKWFLTVHMLAHLHRLHRDDGVGMVWRANNDGIKIPLLLQHFAVIIIGRTTLIFPRWLLEGVIPLNNFSGRFTTGPATLYTFPPPGITDQLPDFTPQFIRLPLTVVAAVPVHVTN
ncbi:hypothetical protein ES703_118359 [subsurface metagenome]